ncbi:MAG: hypothetical protein QXT91_05510 [Candidatus Caldarchaeum sp.]
MNWKLVAAFMLGGLGFMALQPMLAALAAVSIVGLLILLVFTLLIPGGWMLFFGFRVVTGLFRGLVIPLTVLMGAALISTAATLFAGFAAGAVFSFLAGGLMCVYVVSRFRRGAYVERRRTTTTTFAQPYSAGLRSGPADSPRNPVKQEYPKDFDIPLVVVGKALFHLKTSGIHYQVLKNGVVVLGEGSTIAVRTIVRNALEKGGRIVVIGSPYMAAPTPDGATKLVTLGRTSINVLKPSAAQSDKFALRRWAENIAIPLVVSAGLDTAEAGMVVRFIEKFAGVRMTPDDVDKLVAEYGPTSSARLKDAIGLLTTFFGEGYPEPSRLFSGGWRQLVIDIKGLSQEAQLFVGMYLLYEAPNLFSDCMLVFDSAELGIPEQQILPYDARHVWLRTLKAVERLKENGFIMSSSTGLLAPELLDLADTYVITRGPANMRRDLSERIGADVNVASIPVGRAVVFTRAAPDGRTYLFEGEVITTPVCDVQSLRAEEDRRNTLLMEEMLSGFKDTLLFAELADLAEHGYRVLRLVKTSQTPTPERVRMELGLEGEKALKHLLEKQYVLTDPAGVLGLTSLGEHALKDWEHRVKKTETPVERKTVVPAESSGKLAVDVNAGLVAFSKEGKEDGRDFGEVYRLLNRARSMLMRGDALSAVGVAYKASVTALKTLTGADKGHLPELAEKAREKGLVHVEDEEARKLYAANIESKRLIKQAAEGNRISDEDRKRMADAAELLISLAERITAVDSLAGQEEVSND